MRPKLLSPSYSWILLVVALLGVMTALVWINFQWGKFVPPENEFSQQWQITRDFVFNQINPYDSTTVSTFKSPFPALFIYFPFALINDYALAQAVWMTVIQIAILTFTFLCVRNTAWIVNRWYLALLIIFSLAWYPAISAFMRGSSVSIMGAFLLAAVLMLQKDQDELAGILIAGAALELRVTLFSIGLIIFWLATQRKWLSFFWAGVIFLFANGIGMIFLPSWPIDFFWATLRHTDFSFGYAILETTTRWWPGIGVQVGWSIVIAMILLLIIEWWLVSGKTARRLTWTLALTGIISIWIGFETNIDHVYLTFFAWMVIFASWHRRWRRSGLILNLIAMAVLLPLLWWAAFTYQARGIGEAANPVLMIGFPFLALIGLYWARWWYLRPDYLTLNESQLDQ